MKPHILLLIPLLTLTGLYAGHESIPLAHAAGITGQVCLVQPSKTSLGCPTTVPTIPGSGPAGQFQVAVFINGSDSLNGFDITLLTNSTVLKPADAIPGTVNLGGTPRVLVKCIGGSAVVGTCAPNDNASTIHFSETGSLTPSRPETDLLFTAVYNVMANNANTPITFQTGCSATSVPNGVCVTISNGTPTPLAETILTAKFTNLPYFDIEANTGFMTVSEGDTNSSAFLTLTSLNGFGGTTGATVNLAGSSSISGVIVTTSPTSVSLTAGSPGNQTIAGISINVAKTVPPGNYTITLTGTSTGVPPNSITIQLDVPVPDFAIAASPNAALNFNVTVPGTRLITVSSIGNYAANVNVSLTATQGIQASFSNQKTSQVLELKAGKTNSTTLAVRASTAGPFEVTINATSTSGTHVIFVTGLALDFLLLAAQPSIDVVIGQTKIESITISSSSILYNTTVTIDSVAIATITSQGVTQQQIPTGITVSCSPTQLIIRKVVGNQIANNSTDCHVKGVVLGDYFVTVSVTSGSGNMTSNHAAYFQVRVVGPNFSVVLPSVVPTVSVGQSTNVVAKITSNNGLVDHITIDTLKFAGGNTTTVAKVSVNATKVFLTANHNSSVLVTIKTFSNIPPGYYTLTVGGSSHSGNSTSSSASATITIIVVAIASPHNLGVMYVTPSATSATVGQNINIIIEVVNLGKLPENATVIALVGDQSVGTANATNLQAGTNVNETITWHTTGFNPGSYIIGGKVLTAPGQTNTTYSLIRYATPITLVSSAPAPFPYALVIAIAVIVVAAAGIGLFILQRRKPVTSA